jgi:integrase
MAIAWKPATARTSGSSAGNYRMYLVPHFGAMRLNGISEFSVEDYKRKRRDQGAANATINRELTTLSHLFWLDRIPLRIGKQLLAEGEGRIIALDEAQCDALMWAALAGGHPDLWLFVAFGLNTAMRHDEIMNARWEYLNLATRRLFVPQAKAGKREQPITVELAQILEQERASRDDREGWIFPSPHTGTSTGRRGNLRRPFAKAVARAGLDPVVTPHVMRHTAITKLVQEGRDIPTIQKISGHKTFAMVLRYVHVHDQHIDDGIKALGRGLPASPANIGGDETGMPAERDYTGITHAPSPSSARRTKKLAIS